MRLTRERSTLSHTTSTTTRLAVELLEDRLTPSWGTFPPITIAVPPSFVTVALNGSGDASGTAAITANEVDWYKFTATSGNFTISASTPSSNLDTVIALYNSAGQRIAYNDNISSTNHDSRFAAAIGAGTYYLGVTNYTGTAGGSYSFLIDGPAVSPLVSPPPPAVSPPPPASPPVTSGFQITLRTTGMTASQQAIFQQAANRWAQVITGDLPNATYNGIAVDDVLIDASGAAIDGVGGIAGQAGPDAFRSGTLLPIHGTMHFDSADLASLEANGQLYYTALHEMGHVLGIGTLWVNRGLVSGAGTSNPLFTGANAVAAYNAIFGASVKGVPLENVGAAGTRDSHWRDSVFGNEVMTGYLNPGTNLLSRVTIASLADLGYQVNMNAADAYTRPATAKLLAPASGSGSGAAALIVATPAAPAYMRLDDRPQDPTRFDALSAHTTGVRADPVSLQLPVTDRVHRSGDPFRHPLFDLP